MRNHKASPPACTSLRVPGDFDETTFRAEAAVRQVALYTQTDYGPVDPGQPLTLMLGYARVGEPRIEPGVQQIAAALRVSRVR